MSKILIIGSAHPLRGGIAALNEQLARAFQQEDHEVEILSFSLQYPNFLFPGKTQFTTDAAPDDVKIITALNAINPFNWLLQGRRFADNTYDFVIIRFWLPFMAPCLGTVARMIKMFSKNKNIKIIGLTDNVVPHEKRIGDVVFTRYFLSACDSFVAMSRAVLDDIETFEPTKPRTYAPHPIYDQYGAAISKKEARKRLNLEDDGKYILFFGLIRAYKGLDWLLQALADDRLKSRHVKLIIAGEFYDKPDAYEQIIKGNNLEKNITRVTYFIPNENVADYFCAADVVVQPYKTATQSGVSQIAYHFNKPMIVTNTGGLAEIVPHNKAGYVVDCDENAPTQIADALVDYYDNKRENEFIAGIFVEKPRFSWQNMTSALLK